MKKDVQKALDSMEKAFSRRLMKLEHPIGSSHLIIGSYMNYGESSPDRSSTVVGYTSCAGVGQLLVKIDGAKPEQIETVYA